MFGLNRKKCVTFFVFVVFWAATTPLVTADVFKEELIGQVLPLEIHNQCTHPIQVVLMFRRYQPECVDWAAYPTECEICMNSSHYCCDSCIDYGSGAWAFRTEVEGGWWHIEPGVRTGLKGSDGKAILIQPTIYDRIYAYAESTDGSDLSWKGDPAVDGGLITNNRADAMLLSNGEKIPYFEVGGGYNENSGIDNVVRFTCPSEDPPPNNSGGSDSSSGGGCFIRLIY